MKKTMIMLLLALVSWGGYAQHNHGTHGTHGSHNANNTTQQSAPMFKDKNLASAYGHYVHLKDALVASNFVESKKASAELAKSLKEVKNAGKVSAEAEKVAAAPSLAELRKAFTALSNEMALLVKGDKLSKGEIYVAYCSMANNNTGGSWLSNEREIRNPYYGSSMLKCGGVREVIQ